MKHQLMSLPKVLPPPVEWKELYVRAGDPGVIGSGNWAQLRDGRIVGRSIYSGVYLCDVCGREWRPVLAIRSGMAR